MRYTVTKSPLTPVGNTPAIPKPWNLYNETLGELVSCHATRSEAIDAKIALLTPRYSDGRPR